MKFMDCKMPYNPPPPPRPRTMRENASNDQDPQLVQFNNGAYAIRRRRRHGSEYEYLGLDDGTWWSLATGRQWYETMDKTKAQKAFDTLVAQTIQSRKDYAEFKRVREDKGTVVSEIAEKPEGPKNRTISSKNVFKERHDMFKLPKFSKWFTD